MRTDHRITYHPLEQGYRPAAVEWGAPKPSRLRRALLVIGLPLVAWLVLGAGAVALWGVLS